jgi:ATP-binding protein involved in chromosome partitioning
VDPRAAAITERLAGVSRVAAVAGSKGGIGKSVVATTTALALAARRRRVGLFDLDFTSPSAHVILGLEAGFPVEEYGIEPYEAAGGIGVMSVAFLLGESPAPLRGVDATNALLELLAITNWGDLDVLVLDMPPGLGDTSLDVIRLIPRLEFVLVGTASRLVISSVERAATLLGELRVPVAGVVENMRRSGGDGVEALAGRHGFPFLGSIPFDPSFEESIGEVDRLRAGPVFAAAERVVGRLGW